MFGPEKRERIYRAMLDSGAFLWFSYAGDCVTVRPKDVDSPPYVGRIEALLQDDAQQQQLVRLRWLFRAEELDSTTQQVFSLLLLSAVTD